MSRFREHRPRVPYELAVALGFLMGLTLGIVVAILAGALPARG